MENKGQGSRYRFVRTLLIVVVIGIVYAYGFQVTRIDLEEPKQPQRQRQLTNVIRALAHPDLTEYDTERLQIEAPIMVPCPEGEFTLPDLSQSGPAIQLAESCAEPGSEITVTGSGFEPDEEVFLYFVPYKEDVSQEVELRVANEAVKVDKQGNFSYPVTLKKDRTSENPQKIRAVVNRRSGLPRPSQAVYDTFEKIIETIFLALIATTLGTLLSIPTSFLAARNLMIQITSLFGSLVTLIALAPLGWFVGAWLFGTIGGWGVNLIVAGELPSAVVLWPVGLLLLSVQALAHQNRNVEWLAMLRRYGIGLLVALAVALGGGLLAGLGQKAGMGLEAILGPFGFLGNFLFVASDTLAISLPLVGGLAGLFVIASFAGVASENFVRRVGNTLWGKLYTIMMSFLAGMALVGLPAMVIRWLYTLPNFWISVGWPAVIGGLVMTLVAVMIKVDHPMPTGLTVYFITRTILNILRAIEPLIMAIVFVVWVGIGPFAGVLALTLHTIAALGKLYSEQVENISQGPIEAVTAAGANRLQTIIYAVIPQIVPPYIAFTIYRWDINVRMSTIIGFAGGGGIGFLLQQNLNLLKYRQASVQMIAIAIVVASLDYISAKIRERII
jgi:phosphonate ABC transporter permease subunit PhnE